MKTFTGSMTALATPFKNGAFDEAAYSAFVDWQIANGTAALVPMGTTGEAATMSAAERLSAVKACIKAAKGRVPVIAGAGMNSTADTVEQVKAVRDAGADAALVVTPYYNKPTQAGLVEHYRAIGRAHPGFPLVAYNVPGRTGVDLLPETCQRLCDIAEVVALKEATGNMARTVDIYEKCGERLTLLSGDDFTVLPFIACGGKGVISVSSNVVPKHMSELVAAARKGDGAAALTLQVKLNALHRLLFVESNPIPVKWGLHVMGKFSPEMRLPLTPMTHANAEKLKEALAALGAL